MIVLDLSFSELHPRLVALAFELAGEISQIPFKFGVVLARESVPFSVCFWCVHGSF